MTDAMKNKLKAVTKDIFDHVEQQDARVAYLYKGLSNLLEEEDVKNLPTYKLLHGIYSEYLTSKPPAQKTDKIVNEELYDPLYAPPKTRKRVNQRAKKEMLESKFKAEPKPKAETPASAPAPSSVPSYMPDFSESLLEGQGSTKVKVKKVTEPKPVSVQVSKGDTVYTVEIKGNQYLRHSKYLYDKSTHLRVGSIENGAFIIDSKPVSDFETNCTVSSVPDTPYYKDNNGKLYVRLTDEGDIYQGVGELTPEGDIGLWQ